MTAPEQPASNQNCMTANLSTVWGDDYRRWLADLKLRVERARQRAAASANRELVTLYWQIGRDILDRQRRQGWGAGVIDQLARDLKSASPCVISSTCAHWRRRGRTRNSCSSLLHNCRGSISAHCWTS
jgi:hypothetical protein